ncbi:DUF6968 family protein [Enterovirga sp. GCM10030262]|uniref:DUF6968 family protein n=1 Tax=Enterovirga sp. GCM10030262 TaxID=3273391 RepID=UPI003609EB71
MRERIIRGALVRGSTWKSAGPLRTARLAPGGEYRCRWRIIGLGQDRSRDAAGIDSVQALMLAMRTVHAELSESHEYKAGKLTYLDQTDLDLPPMWGSGSLYDAGPSPSD